MSRGDRSAPHRDGANVRQLNSLRDLRAELFRVHKMNHEHVKSRGICDLECTCSRLLAIQQQRDHRRDLRACNASVRRDESRRDHRALLICGRNSGRVYARDLSVFCNSYDFLYLMTSKKMFTILYQSRASLGIS